MRKPVTATAPGKIILFGEHAVVYGQPAIAVPVHQVQASVSVEPAPSGSGLTLIAEDLDRVTSLAEAPDDDPLAVIVRLTLASLHVFRLDARLTIRSAIPIASGLGSGTAVSTAIVRALAAYLGREFEPDKVSQLVYEVEKLHHGTPSGIDNTVVAFGTPVFFVRGKTPETFDVGSPLRFLIGDTGSASSTRAVVGAVRRAWERNPVLYDRIFGQIGSLVQEARELIEVGGGGTPLGELMDRNHSLLCEMGVSSTALERLVTAARKAGALGAKLSGAGHGGNMIALVAPGDKERVAEALLQAGVVQVIETEV